MADVADNDLLDYEEEEQVKVASISLLSLLMSFTSIVGSLYFSISISKGDYGKGKPIVCRFVACQPLII